MPDETPSNTKTIAAVIVGLALLVTNVALGGAILAKGLRGEFVSTSSTSAASAFDGVSGGSPTVTDGTCLLDVSLQAEGVFPIGIPLDWHNESNIIVKVNRKKTNILVKYHSLSIALPLTELLLYLVLSFQIRPARLESRRLGPFRHGITRLFT